MKTFIQIFQTTYKFNIITFAKVSHFILKGIRKNRFFSDQILV